jgi:hypothetical protein
MCIRKKYIVNFRILAGDFLLHAFWEMSYLTPVNEETEIII